MVRGMGNALSKVFGLIKMIVTKAFGAIAKIVKGFINSIVGKKPPKPPGKDHRVGEASGREAGQDRGEELGTSASAFASKAPAILRFGVFETLLATIKRCA